MRVMAAYVQCRADAVPVAVSLPGIACLTPYSSGVPFQSERLLALRSPRMALRGKENGSTWRHRASGRSILRWFSHRF
jgi:hypothetical protein